MKIKLNVVNAFTQNKEEGNPAGIVLDADHLSVEQMIAITAQTGFSECAFIQKSKEADFKVRFFSSKQEVDLCGHATIAFFSLMLSKLPSKIEGVRKFTQETRVGTLSVYCYSNGLVEMEQSSPKILDFNVEKGDIATLLNIPPLSLNGPLKIVSTGSPKLIIPIDSLKSLFEITPDLKGIAEYCTYSGARGFYPFTCQTLDPNSDFHARQFNPLAGINEDPITGIAAGALGSYIKHNGSNKSKFVIEQGYVLKKLGKIFVNVEDKILVGGYAVPISERVLLI